MSIEQKQYNRTLLGHVIRQAREHTGYTQEYVSSAIGIHRTSLVAIEQGNRKVSTEELMQLASVLHCDLKVLLNEYEACVTDETLKVELLALTAEQKRVLSHLLTIEPTPTIRNLVKLLSIPREELANVASAIIRVLVEDEV
jgi:transcriptional regulator with XRE-family HTH domain